MDAESTRALCGWGRLPRSSMLLQGSSEAERLDSREALTSASPVVDLDTQAEPTCTKGSVRVADMRTECWRHKTQRP